MKIYLDTEGGDNSPLEIIAGGVESGKLTDAEIILLGKPEVIKQALNELHAEPSRFEIIPTEGVVTMDDEPVRAVRANRSSSLVLGTKAVAGNNDSVFVSAGSTGALLVASTLFTGRIKGLSRAALGVIIPAQKPTLLIDNGANADCRAENLVQFALMGSAYMRFVMGIKSPSVGLANIGTEDAKGSLLYKEAHELLRSCGHELNFIGNVEMKNVLTGVCDIIVCDGFTGNIILKTIEGSLKYAKTMLKSVFTANALTKLSYLGVKKELNSAFSTIDPRTTGGVPIIGVNGCVIKAHGSSDREAIKNAVLQGIKYANSGVVAYLTEHMSEEFAH